jgi:hypothetical protein
MLTGQYVFLFDPYSPTYMSAAGNGLVHELPDSIKTQLYNLYRVELPFFQLLYDQQQENITNFRNNIMLPADVDLYRHDLSKISPDITVWAKKIQGPAYGNFINQTIIIEQKVYERNEDASDALTALEDMLGRYISMHKEGGNK